MTQVPRALSRRTLFAGMAGAGTAGVLAAAAHSLAPGQAGPGPAVPDPTPDPTPDPAPARGGGYRLSEHVLKYFQTTRV